MAKQRNVRDLDATGLRALAHPVRMKLLNLLIEAPATASGLARRIGESSGTTSWHLRQLAEYGFVVEDEELGNRRERWWRAIVEGTRFDDFDALEQPGTPGALESFLYAFLADDFDHAVRYVGAIRDWPREWQRATGVYNAKLSLRAAQARELTERMEALVEEYRRDPQDGDERVRVSWQAYPLGRDDA